jgi:hypothetical protein
MVKADTHKRCLQFEEVKDHGTYYGNGSSKLSAAAVAFVLSSIGGLDALVQRVLLMKGSWCVALNRLIVWGRWRASVLTH